MKLDKLADGFVERLKKPIAAVPFVGFISGLMLYLFRDYGASDILLVTILAFLSSDFLMWVFIKGGRGILQVALFGTRTQPKGYGFIAFFFCIIGVAVFVNTLTDGIVTVLSSYFPEITVDILVGLILAALVYLAVHVRFYAHSK